MIFAFTSKLNPLLLIRSCTICKCSSSSLAIIINSVTNSSFSEFCYQTYCIRGGFCSHQAWSVKISSIFDSTMFTILGLSLILILTSPLLFFTKISVFFQLSRLHCNLSCFGRAPRKMAIRLGSGYALQSL
jgi:hypothetical protein